MVSSDAKTYATLTDNVEFQEMSEMGRWTAPEMGGGTGSLGRGMGLSLAEGALGAPFVRQEGTQGTDSRHPRNTREGRLSWDF
jgi:hypothetical protein